jgi:hypothetical protein
MTPIKRSMVIVNILYNGLIAKTLKIGSLPPQG